MEHIASERISWKKALQKERPLLLPVAHDALTAKILEQSGFAADRPQNYEGAKYGWSKFFANLEQVLARTDLARID